MRPSACLITVSLLSLPACHAQPDAAKPPASTPAPLAAAAGAPAVAPTRTVGFPQYPSISPDGRTIVFSWAGDLWSVPASGGLAARLTAHPSDEERSAFSPDGQYLAFDSERDGTRSIYLMAVTPAGEPGADGAPSANGGGGWLVGGPPRRITLTDRPVTLSGFSHDGAHVLFSASLEPGIYRMTRMYRAAINGPETGGSRIERLTDAYGGSPHASPDGSLILFNRERYDPTRTKYTGPANCDIYSLDTRSGAFTRLTYDPHADGEAYALPDGSIVFVSARSGENNLFRLKPGTTDQGGGLQQLTHFKVAGPGTGTDQTTIMHGVRDLSVTGWNAVFCVWDTLYTLDLKNPQAEPRAVTLNAGGDFAQLDYLHISAGRQIAESALSPDGKTLAVIARGEVFVRSTEKDRPTRHVTATGKPSPWGRCRDLAWSPDGRVLYFSSDASGVSGIYAATVALAREDLTSDELPDRAPEPKAGEQPKAPEPAPGGAPDPNAAATPKDAQPEPKADEPEAGQPASKTDEKKDAKPAAKKPDHGKRWAEAITFKVEPVLVGSEELRNPLPSPDGKRLLVTRGLGDLVLFDVARDNPASVNEASARVVLNSWNMPDAQWAADSRHIIYAAEDVWFNSDIWLLDTLAEPGSDAAKPINLTRHPDMDHSPRLSADGKVLYFLSDRDAVANGRDDIFAITLDSRLDGLRPYELAEYFKEAADRARKRTPLGAAAAASSASRPARPGRAAPPADDKPEDRKDEAEKKDDKPSPENPLKFDAHDAYRRARKLTGLPENIGSLAITPGGERVIFTVSVDGSSQLLSVDYQGRERKTVFSGPATQLSVSLTGDRVLFVSGGAAPRGETPGESRARGGGDPYLGRPAGGETERLPIDAPLVIDVAAQQKQKFIDAARLMGQRFYHPTLKGLDWPALMSRYLSLAIQTRTDTEFNRVFNNLLGELDASHMGMSGGRSTSGDGRPIGYLGIDVKPVPGGYEVTRVIDNGPADRKNSRLNPGDVILSINNKPLAPDAQTPPSIDFMAAMVGTSGQETLLEVRRAAAGGSRHLLVTPISASADTILRYQDEVERRRQLVEKLSDGKLGYLHIRAMDMASVRDFERDLFAAADGKLGLIIDVRDNGGGSTADILLASLTAPRHAYTANRGVDLKSLPKDAYPRDRRLIYAYNREISVLCNQHSYSNAEIFSHAIKTTGRGKLVGAQTFGAVISTGSYSLIDGTTMRTPFRGWYLPDGTDMENNGCMPDIPVSQTPEDEVAGRDPQLEAAVKELLTRAREF